MAITSTGSAEVLADGLNGARGSAPGSIDIVGGSYGFDVLNAARDTADGEIALSQQASVAIRGGALGDYGTARGALEAGATGTITVEDAGTRLAVESDGASRIEVSRFGTGFLDILNGGVAEAYWIEAARNGEGSVSIDGSGSLLLLSGDNGQF